MGEGEGKRKSSQVEGDASTGAVVGDTSHPGVAAVVSVVRVGIGSDTTTSLRRRSSGHKKLAVEEESSSSSDESDSEDLYEPNVIHISAGDPANGTGGN